MRDIQEIQSSLTVFDEFGTLKNNSEAIKWVLSKLENSKSVAFAWTDEEGTQLDLILTYKPFYDPENARLIQGGVRVQHDLLVSVLRHGAFGFQTGKDITETHFNYYKEKLNVGFPAFADFLNAIRQNLN